LKSLLKIIILFGILTKGYSQIDEQVSFSINVNNKVESTFKMDHRISVFKKLNVKFNPQFGGLFSKGFRNLNGLIDLKSYYDDFDFGLNVLTNWELVKNIKMTAIYSFGLLKFNALNLGTIPGPIVKLSIDYRF